MNIPHTPPDVENENGGDPHFSDPERRLLTGDEISEGLDHLASIAESLETMAQMLTAVFQKATASAEKPSTETLVTPTRRR